jgi:anthranilate phosphoribosyltransferase
MFRDYLQKICNGRHLSREEAADALQMIIGNNLSPAETGGFLVGLRVKGETTEEILGFIDVMEKHAVKIELQDKNAIDVCGTGGDGSHSFNVSTTAAIIAAAAGATVAKHGNRSVSSLSGSADLLEALGVRIDLPPEQVASCINETGIGFMFAPHFHPAMKAVAPHRRSLGIRTFFNMLGPLLNPAGVRRQLIGAYDIAAAQQIAEVMQKRNYLKACTVHSSDGLDEVSPFAENHIFEVQSNQPGINHYLFRPYKSYGSDLSVAGSDSKANAEITRSVLGGKPGAFREMSVINAAFAVYVADKVASVQEGIGLCEEAIDSGLAMNKLEQLRQFSNDVAS